MKTRRNFIVDSTIALAAICVAPAVIDSFRHTIKLGVINGNMRRYTWDCFLPALGSKTPLFMQSPSGSPPSIRHLVGEVEVVSVTETEVQCNMRVIDHAARMLVATGAVVPCSAGNGSVELVTGPDGDHYVVKDFELTGFFLSPNPA